MGGQTHEPVQTASQEEVTAANTTQSDPAEGKVNAANENQEATNEIAPETENPTAKTETVADASNPDDGAAQG